MSKVIGLLLMMILVSGTAVRSDAAGPGDSATPGTKRTGANYGQNLKRLDADKDGTVSKSEFTDPRLKKFKDLDANRDGAVDGGELEAPLAERSEYRVKRLMKRLDANSDSKISRDEFQAVPRERFRVRDINSDGKLTAEDLPPGTAKSRSWFGGADKTEGSKARNNKRFSQDSLEAVDAKSAADFAKLDANADGSADIDELKQQAAERIAFSKKRTLHTLDADNDGRLTEAEFTAKLFKRFAVLDLNDDGRIASDDFAPSSRGWLFGK